MVLYVTRHGETEYNVQNRYAGSTDVPLNAKGFCQAKELASKLDSIHFDVIISSPLIRAMQTAEVIQKVFSVPMIIMSEFAERNVGVYEGLTRDEARAKYPDLWTRLGSWPLDDAPTGGETIRQFDARIASGLVKLETKHSNNKVLLVCHGFTARTINRQLTGGSFEDMHSFTLGNCEVTEYTV